MKLLPHITIDKRKFNQLHRKFNQLHVSPNFKAALVLNGFEPEMLLDLSDFAPKMPPWSFETYRAKKQGEVEFWRVVVNHTVICYRIQINRPANPNTQTHLFRLTYK